MKCKTSNFQNFQPIVRKSTNTISFLECIECCNYAGVLIDNNLNWKHDVDSTAVEISEIIDIV